MGVTNKRTVLAYISRFSLGHGVCVCDETSVEKYAPEVGNRSSRSLTSLFRLLRSKIFIDLLRLPQLLFLQTEFSVGIQRVAGEDVLSDNRR